MKRGLVALVLAMFVAPLAFGTIITNTNQSVQYLRLLSRNASLGLDAVYYNPAGVVHLENGFHLAIHNQTLFQTRTVTNAFPFLNNSEYVGKATAPVWPSIFAVYKKDKLALAFGAGINSGGGTAEFKTGLPSFEIPISLLPPLVSSFGIPTSVYSAYINFSGLSYYLGFQLNAAYAINEVFSVAAGVRYITARNTYEGELTDIMIDPQHPLINPGGGLMSAAQFFNMIGQPGYAAMVQDMYVDTEQKGTAWTPLLGLNIRPSDRLNIGIRYEFNTKLTLKNETAEDDTGMFPDGYSFRADIPAIFSLGVQYGLTENFRAMLSYHYFFDKNANWNGDEKLVDSNSYDVAIGLEYDIASAFTISAGYLRTQVGVSDAYQSDFSHELSSNSVGGGVRIMLAQKVALELGALYVKYDNASRNMTTEDYPLPFSESYERWAWAFAVGLEFGF
jgi:long-chain fatty acid transport protein